MEILRLLSEEVFDFETNLTSSKAAYLKQNFCSQFQAVHTLCLEILVIVMHLEFVDMLPFSNQLTASIWSTVPYALSMVSWVGSPSVLCLRII